MTEWSFTFERHLNISMCNTDRDPFKLEVHQAEMANVLLLLFSTSCSRFAALVSFWHFSYIDSCSCVVQKKNSSRDLLSFCSPEASKAQERDNRRSLTVSCIPGDVCSTPFDIRSSKILDPPSFIRNNSNHAPRSLDIDKDSLVLPRKPSGAVLELSPAKAVSHHLPHHATHCSKIQHNEVAYTNAITDISLVEVCNPENSMGDSWVYQCVDACLTCHLPRFMMHLPIFILLFHIQGVEMTNESYTGEQVEHIEIQSASLFHEGAGSSFVAAGVKLELLSKAG
jgi:hypothetical protein